MINIIIATFILILGIPIGMLLAKFTKEELKSGKPYFKIIVYLSLIAGFTGLIIHNDILLFTSFFVAIVTSQSLKR